MANSRYNRLDNQAPVQTALKADDVSVGRSAFDFSCIHNGSAILGALVPIDCFDVVPNEDIDLSLATVLEFRNPSTRQLLNGFRVFFHAYYNRLTDLWEGARNWLDNGRTGKINLTRPNLIYKLDGDDMPYVNGKFPSGSFVNACTPNSLLNYLGLPVQAINKRLSSSSTDIATSPLRSFQTAVNCGAGSAIACSATKVSESPDFFPADCAFAYQRNWRDYYCNKNLLQNNAFWFPDNEEHFILSYSAQNCCGIAYGAEDMNPSAGDPDYTKCLYNLVGSDFSTSTPSTIDYTKFYQSTPEPNNPHSSTADIPEYIQIPNLSGLKFRQFRGDRFTTALPFPDLIRGDIPSMSLTMEQLADVVLAKDNDSSVLLQYYNGTYADDTQTDMQILLDSDNNRLGYHMDSASFGSGSTASLKAKVNASTSVTMSDIYTLETLTAFRRRMGMTNGDYNEMIKSQYGVSPHVHDRKGTYIGGFYQDFAFSSVTQQSESATTPLGTKAGQGQSSGSGSIGHFHTPDFGWIQIYMSIVPDVYYTQGVNKMFSKKSNMEMYFPIFNNLPAQAILNKELYVSGDESVDNDVFAFEDRYAEYKSRQNRVSGFMSLSPDDYSYDTAKIMARRFTSTPALNNLFVTMVPENIDMSVFSVVDEPPIDFSIGISCRRVFPGPYTAIEGSLSSPALVRG